MYSVRHLIPSQKTKIRSKALINFSLSLLTFTFLASCDPNFKVSSGESQDEPNESNIIASTDSPPKLSTPRIQIGNITPDQFILEYATNLKSKSAGNLLAKDQAYQRKLKEVQASYPKTMWEQKLREVREEFLSRLAQSIEDPSDTSSFESLFYGGGGAPELTILEVRPPEAGSKLWTLFATLKFTQQDGARIVSIKEQMGERRLAEAQIRIKVRDSPEGWQNPEFSFIPETMKPFPIPELNKAIVESALSDFYLTHERRPSFGVIKRHSDDRELLENTGFKISQDSKYRSHFYIGVPPKWSRFAADDAVTAIPGIRFFLGKNPAAQILHVEPNGKVVGVVYSVAWEEVEESLKVAKAIANLDILKEVYQLTALRNSNGPCIGFLQMEWDVRSLKWNFGIGRGTRFQSSQDREFTYRYPETSDSPRFLSYGSKGFTGIKGPFYKWENCEPTFFNNFMVELKDGNEGWDAIQFSPNPDRVIEVKYEMQ